MAEARIRKVLAEARFGERTPPNPLLFLPVFGSGLGKGHPVAGSCRGGFRPGVSARGPRGQN